ncbi:2-oxoglutarate:acceptor oxidoreductase [Campylobacter sp. MIT 99-7217]|uniref:CiaD-like domain-containing protein n=1 Tax=Campylobacter sp. MIT 99-7217 TaxID=535091 RepID=UPI001158C9FA|nr:2-oxoglutarate:acceptor oxidoreductase [Campylobacter sp. MIT 99-7217]TQR32995.1 2-oxoglutarate:acceptor oxidoreductase [Campylobacter sp. MIT 99-7217]
MNLEDLAKKAIDEVHTQIEQNKQEPQKKDDKEELEEKIASAKTHDEQLIDSNEAEVIDFMPYEEKIEQEAQDEAVPEKEFLLTSTNEAKIVKEEPNEIEEAKMSFNDELFLKNIRERILVLFEGLNSVDKEDLPARLELSINFLEFLLANIEDKLKD